MKKKRTGLKIFLSILGVFVAGIAAFALFLGIGLDLKDVSIDAIDLSKIPNGIYTGETNGSRFGNELQVTVNGGKITDIQILRDVVISVPEVSTELFQKIIDEQSLRVDCVSGATVTSKAYLLSIENALKTNQ